MSAYADLVAEVMADTSPAARRRRLLLSDAIRRRRHRLRLAMLGRLR